MMDGQIDGQRKKEGHSDYYRAPTTSSGGAQINSSALNKCPSFLFAYITWFTCQNCIIPGNFDKYTNFFNIVNP